MKKVTSDLLRPDVNVLVAMAWPNHQFHQAAVHQLESSQNRWATCALMQLGFIRLSANRAVVGSRKSPAEAAALLSLMVEDARHVFLEALPSPIAQDFGAALHGLLGHQQVTDAYLLALAGRYEATFLTFDARMKHLTAPCATLEILGQPA
jgi:toxin-antitoxin system PIN domain toxin